MHVKRGWYALGLSLVLPSVVAGQAPQRATGRYFGQAPPGDTPVVFAPGVISLADRYEQFLLYSPDGQELTFGVTNSTWSEFSLYHTRMEEDGWSEPVLAPFQGRNPLGLTAAISYTMSTAFTSSSAASIPPVDIYRSERGDGGWSEPTRVDPPVSSEANEFEVSIARDGTLYFASNREGGLGDMDIYIARPVDGEYPEVENLGGPINASSGDDLPFIAPDQSYLIFASDRPGGLGNRDLYISYRRDGAWTEPQNLGPSINSEQWDIYPSISPDDRYLFFTRREGWTPENDSDIYWVSADFIDRLEQTAQPAPRADRVP